jgi:hypothetical protein
MEKRESRFNHFSGITVILYVNLWCVKMALNFGFFGGEKKLPLGFGERKRF